MALGDGTLSKTVSTWIGGTSIVTIAGMILWSQVENMHSELKVAKKDSEIALNVAAQHGKEFLLVRNDLRDIQKTLSEVRAQINLGGRFTREDGETLKKDLHEIRQMLYGIQREHMKLNTNGAQPEWQKQ